MNWFVTYNILPTIVKSEMNYRIIWVGRDLHGSLSPTHAKAGSLPQVTQESILCKDGLEHLQRKSPQPLPHETTAVGTSKILLAYKFPSQAQQSRRNYRNKEAQAEVYWKRWIFIYIFFNCSNTLLLRTGQKAGNCIKILATLIKNNSEENSLEGKLKLLKILTVVLLYSWKHNTSKWPTLIITLKKNEGIWALNLRLYWFYKAPSTLRISNRLVKLNQFVQQMFQLTQRNFTFLLQKIKCYE